MNEVGILYFLSFLSFHTIFFTCIHEICCNEIVKMMRNIKQSGFYLFLKSTRPRVFHLHDSDPPGSAGTSCRPFSALVLPAGSYSCPTPTGRTSSLTGPLGRICLQTGPPGQAPDSGGQTHRACPTPHGADPPFPRAARPGGAGS